VKLTKPGAFYIALTIFIGFAAVNTGNNLLFLIVAALLGFMAVSGIFGWLNIHRLSLRIELADEIYDGKDTFVSVSLENKKSIMATFLIRVKVCGEWLDFNLVNRRGRETGSLVLNFQGRGYGTLTEIIIQSCFPINFFVRSKIFVIPERFVIFPAPRACHVPADITARGTRGEAVSRCRGFAGDVLKIRDYTGSEPMKLIHWRLSAKHEEFKVKEMAGSTNQPVILDIELLPGADLEGALSCGAFLVNMYIRQNRPVGLKSGGLLLKPDLSGAHRLRLLTELATYGKH
jgi:uncharacterized protein (DUF58 family)